MAEDMITVPLAHRLPAKEARRLGAVPVRGYEPGDDVTVPRRAAEMLFGAAQLQGHPRSDEDRDRILGSGARIVPQAADEGAVPPAGPVPPAPGAVTVKTKPAA